MFRKRFNRNISLLVDQVDEQAQEIKRLKRKVTAIESLEKWMNPVRVWNGIRATKNLGETHYDQYWFCRIDGWPYACTGKGHTIAEAVKDCEAKIAEAKEASHE